MQKFGKKLVLLLSAILPAVPLRCYAGFVCSQGFASVPILSFEGIQAIYY